MSRIVIPDRSAMRVVYFDPENTRKAKTDATRLLSAANGASSLFAVYDDRAVSSLRASAAISATVLEVYAARKFTIGDTVELELDTLDLQVVTISDVDPDAGTITVPSLSASASAGRQIRRKLGSDYPMAEFGTPTQGDVEGWGFDEALPENFAGRAPGLDLSIEIQFSGAGAGGLDIVKRLAARTLAAGELLAD